MGKSEISMRFKGDKATKAAKILSHPLSRDIIDILSIKNAHINEIAALTNNHATTVNRHIRQLEELGIVKGELTQEDCPTICKRYSLKYNYFRVEYRFSSERGKVPTVDIGYTAK